MSRARIVRILAAIVRGTAVGTGAVLVAAATLFGLLNTGPGQNGVAFFLGPFTGGRIFVSGVSGTFPGPLHVGHFELADTHGVWLRVDDATMEWSPMTLLGNRLNIAKVDAAAVSVARRPVSSDDSEDSDFQLDIAALSVVKLDLPASLLGSDATFGAHGSAHYRSLRDTHVNLFLERSDKPGHYRIDASLNNGVVTGAITADEGPGGLLASLIDVEDIGPLKLAAQAGGGRDANTIEISLEAGALRAAGKGTFSLPEARADVDFSARAPAMSLRPDLSWQALEITGHSAGSWYRPEVKAHFDARNLVSDGNSIADALVDVTGTGGALEFDGKLSGLVIEGLEPRLFQRTPIGLKGHAELRPPARNITLSLSHPLIGAEGVLALGARPTATAMITAPDVAPFSPALGLRIAGPTSIAATATFGNDTTHIAGGARVAVTGGDDTLIRLFGKDWRLTASGDLNGGTAAISEASLSGNGTEARLGGTVSKEALDMNGTLSLPDIARLVPSLSGNARMRLSARGPIKQARVEMSAEGDIATQGFAKEHVTLTAAANGLAKPLSGNLRAAGSFNGAPVALDGNFAWTAAGLALGIERGQWKSLAVNGSMNLNGQNALDGQAALRVDRLEDIAPLIGVPLDGSLEATLGLGKGQRAMSAKVNAKLHNVGIESIRIPDATIRGDIMDPTGTPQLVLDLDAANLDAYGVRSHTNARLTGRINSPTLRVSSDIAALDGNPAKLSGTASWDGERHQVLLSAFNGSYRGDTWTLAAPARIDTQNGLSIAELRLKAKQGEVAVKGAISPALNASITVQNLEAGTLRPFLPQLAEGTIAGTAQLTGTLEVPTGKVDVQGTGLRLSAVSEGIARARANLHAELHGTHATVDGTIEAGTATRLTLNGDAPLSAERPLDLSSEGSLDLALLNPVLSALGRSVRGKATLSAKIAGTYEAPRMTGSAQLSGGEVQDVARGMRIADITLSAEASGRTIQISKFTGRAGSGTVSGSGTIEPFASGTPVDLTLTAQNARLMASDHLTATANANLKVRGPLMQRVAITGNAEIIRADITLPETLPRAVVALKVTHNGQPEPKEAQPPAAAIAASFDINVTSHGQFFVRGRGVDAEVEGQIHAGGIDTDPVISGAFTLRRGTLSVAGETLDLTSGKISFDGTSLRNGLDPSLDLRAQTMSNGVTAQVAITGYASEPRIQLSSTPQLASDEILSRLIFRQSTTQLSPFQLAEIGQAAASLGGVGTGFDPIGSIRDRLGLNRLAVGSTTLRDGTTDPTVEAGRYVTRRVYVGSKQGLSGGTQAEVQIDLTKNLKAQGTVNTGSNATVTQGAAHEEIGTSVGLTYQFEY